MWCWTGLDLTVGEKRGQRSVPEGIQASFKLFNFILIIEFLRKQKQPVADESWRDKSTLEEI